MTDKYLPPHFRSAHRFVPVLSSLLRQHSTRGTASISFNPLEMNLSTRTAIARLRDAVTAFSSGLTTHPSVDGTALKEVWRQYRITSDGVNVLVVSRATKQDESAQIQADTGTELAVLKADEAGFVEALTAFAVLLGQRYLRGEVSIRGDLSDSLRHRLESEHDIAIIQDGHQQYHMV